ncbi:PH domain-containing protein [Actinosynnema sp. NPDC059335]|uniref:PH domain-containing protein n=1 Tax=Actinosynnema sp. NPDC059335 TaxID=3346804 RepID=UPI0036717EAB
MAYPDDLLRTGEHVVVHRHPHWKTLIAPVLVLVVVVVGGAYLAVLVSDFGWASVAWTALAALAAVLIAWLTLAPLVRWRTTHFIVTDERVMYRFGVLKRTGLDIRLDRIDGVRSERGPVDRLFGCGTLVVESGADEPWEFDDIPAVDEVLSLLHPGRDRVGDHRTEDRVTDGRA